VSESPIAPDVPFEFALPDASAGGELLSAEELATDHDAVLIVLLRSHYCPLCREIVQSFAEAYQSFASRSTAVVPVLPDTVERGAVWQRRYELPFPILADHDETSDGFEAFAPYQRNLRELPGAILFRASKRNTGDGLELVTTFSEERPRDFPAVGAILDEVEACTGSPTAAGAGPRADS